MKPKLMHQEAMELSFRAKQAIAGGDFFSANELYIQSAKKEGELAKFYFDKPDQEPTRSIILRSAVFLHLKAGLISEAQQLIYWGLLNLEDIHIKEQLEKALEHAIALKNIDFKSLSYNVEYFQLLRMRSVNYTMETVQQSFSNLVSLEMFKDFADNYLRSLRSYAKAMLFRHELVIKKTSQKIEDIAEQFEQSVNPLITTAGIGSFTFSIANDFLSRGEDQEFAKLKGDIIINYHEKIFINPLSDGDIQLLKEEFKEEEINHIFKPITKIKTDTAPYKVAYYDIDSYHKKYVPQIAKAQRKKLLPLFPPSAEDIGILESSIIHARQLNDGKKKRNVILKEQLKTYELEFKTNQIEPKELRPLILNEEIVIEVNFDAEKGFTFSFEELAIHHTDIDYNLGLQSFYTKFYSKLIEIINIHKESGNDSPEWKIISKLLNNPQSLIK